MYVEVLKENYASVCNVLYHELKDTYDMDRWKD